MSTTEQNLSKPSLYQGERLAGQALRANLDIVDLRSFLAVARHLNFTRAAGELFIATSPLSRRIQDIEKSLGVDLFKRSSHSVALTPFGRRLVPLAKDIVARFDDIHRHMVAGEPAVFDIGHTSTTPPDLVGSVVRAVEQIYPRSEIELVCARDVLLFPRIIDGSIDLGVVVEPPPDPRIGSLHLRTLHTGVLMRQDDPRASASQLSLSDFADARFVLIGPGRAPFRVKIHEAQLVAVGVRDFEYTDDFLEVAWKVANRGSYGIGILESAPSSDVYAAFGLVSRPALGFEAIWHQALVWSKEWAIQDPSFANALRALRSVLG